VQSDLVQNSESAAQILGIDPQKIVTATSFLARVHPDDREGLKTLVSSIGPGNPSYAANFRYLRPDGRETWLEETSKAEFDGAGHLVRLEGLMLDITERKRAEERQKVLIAELDHRIKNVLARVASVAMQTREGSSSMDQFVKTLDGRIQSMAAAHSLLSQARWTGVGLTDLVRDQLSPYSREANVDISGPDVMLNAATTQAIAMTLHELATNAAKYGALSTPDGQVSVLWKSLVGGDEAEKLIIEWREAGGPIVKAPPRSGFGTSLIRDLIPHELGGTVDLLFGSDGARCRIEAPLERL
jgi:PAS domain S-box-containing protein